MRKCARSSSTTSSTWPRPSPTSWSRRASRPRSPAAAPPALERFTAEPADVVVTDLRMKNVDGLDVLEGVKRVDPDGARCCS